MPKYRLYCFFLFISCSCNYLSASGEKKDIDLSYDTSRLEGKPLTLVIGRPNSGVSTLINTMIFGIQQVKLPHHSTKPNKTKEKSRFSLQFKRLKSIGPLIGHPHDRCTKEPCFFLNPIEKNYYGDTAAFLDEKKEEKLVNSSLTIQDAINKASSIKIIFLISYTDLTHEKERFLNTLRLLESLLAPIHEQGRMNNASILFALTSVNHMGVGIDFYAKQIDRLLTKAKKENHLEDLDMLRYMVFPKQKNHSFKELKTGKRSNVVMVDPTNKEVRKKIETHLKQNERLYKEDFSFEHLLQAFKVIKNLG